MRARVERTYRPSDEDGAIIVYAGDLAVTQGAEQRAVGGQLELHLAPSPRFFAHFAGPSCNLLFLDPWSRVKRSVSVPDQAALTPPGESVLPENPGDIDWVDDPDITIGKLDAGDIRAAARFVFHISGALRAWFPSVKTLGGRCQQQFAFSLPGWGLVIAPVESRHDERDFIFAIEARPESPASTADIGTLAQRLFILLSFMAGREVGVLPVCGLDAAGNVVWARWGAPRTRPGTPGVHWCSSRTLFATAFPDIVAGLTVLSKNAVQEAVVGRAVEHLLAASGNEALDVRVPIACSGLEMLGSAVLARQGKDVPENAACKLRELLAADGVCATIPRTSGTSARAARVIRVRTKTVPGSSSGYATSSSTHL